MAWFVSSVPSNSSEARDSTRSRRARVWEIRLGKRRWQLGRSGTLLVSRVYEQSILGFASLALAWRLGVTGFAPVSALLIFNSFAVVASDFGLGTDLMHRPVGVLARSAFWRVRILDLAVLVSLVLAGAAVASPWRELSIGAGFVWIASSEAFVRKSALIRLDRTGRAARGEMAGSTVLIVGIGLALVFPTYAITLVAAGLASKHAVEALVDQGWADAFALQGPPKWGSAVWLSGLLNFAIANVDFLIVVVVVSGDAFSIYSLGFRVAAVFVAQVSYVVSRVALVDFGEAHRAGNLDDVYRHRRKQMFVGGVVAGIATAALSPLLPVVLGPQWRAVEGVVVVLSIAVPWRMCGGLGLMSAIAVGEARRLAGWEASRLAIAAVALTIGGFLGFKYFTVAAAMVAIFTTIGYDRAALGFSGSRRSSWILFTAPVALILISLAVVLLPMKV